MKFLFLRSAAVLTALFLVCAGEGSAGEAAKSPAPKAPARRGEIVVTKSDERSLIFEYRPQFTMPREIQQDGQKYTLYNFSGSISADIRAGRHSFGRRAVTDGVELRQPEPRHDVPRDLPGIRTPRRSPVIDPKKERR